MNFSQYDIVFQEVPDEMSLAFYMTGCPLRCKGCHSAQWRDACAGQEFNISVFQSLLNKYKRNISCVVFFGGDWNEKELYPCLDLAKQENLLTCLYTGNESVSSELLKRLDFIKTGPYIPELGPLSSASTNQRFTDLRTGESLNHRFVRSPAQIVRPSTSRTDLREAV